MNDKVIRMAIECQLINTSNRTGIYADALQKFADLIRADERNAILLHAKSHAFNRMHGEKSPSAYELERWIEARGAK